MKRVRKIVTVGYRHSYSLNTVPTFAVKIWRRVNQRNVKGTGPLKPHTLLSFFNDDGHLNKNITIICAFHKMEQLDNECHFKHNANMFTITQYPLCEESIFSVTDGEPVTVKLTKL